MIIIVKIQTNDKLSREMGYFIDRRKRKVRERGDRKETGETGERSVKGCSGYRGDGSRVHDASCLAASEKPASDKY